MKREKVYRKIASLIVTIQNCKESNNQEWLEKHTENLIDIQKNNLPSGNGIDNGSTIDLIKSNSETIIINSSFHVMDDNGYYDRWIDFTVTVKPSLQFDYVMAITGKFGKHQDLKEYLMDAFSYCLEQVNAL